MKLFIFLTLAVLFLGLFAILSVEDCYLSGEFPYIWRVSHSHPGPSQTCLILRTIGQRMKTVIENSRKNIDELHSIDDIIESLAKNGLTEPWENKFLAKDYWEKLLKLKIGKKGSAKSILIYSASPNEFLIEPNDYNLFVELLVDANGKVTVSATRVSDRGQIVVDGL